MDIKAVEASTAKKLEPSNSPTAVSGRVARPEKIFICGDPHGRFGHIIGAINQFHPDAVVILGDLVPRHSLDDIFKDIGKTEIFWIPGNHDADSDLIYDRLWRSKFGTNNLHGKVLDVAGVKIAGLGGVFRGQIWMPPNAPLFRSPSVYLKKIDKGSTWRGGLPRRHRTTIFSSDYEKLQIDKAEVLVTHEAPSAHEKGFKCIDKLAQDLGVKYLFHAHQHESKNYGEVNGCIARGVGLRGIVNLAGEIIVPAEVDLRPSVRYHNPTEAARKQRQRKQPSSKFRRRLYTTRRTHQNKKEP